MIMIIIRLIPITFGSFLLCLLLLPVNFLKKKKKSDPVYSTKVHPSRFYQSKISTVFTKERVDCQASLTNRLILATFFFSFYICYTYPFRKIYALFLFEFFRFDLNQKLCFSETNLPVTIITVSDRL